MRKISTLIVLILVLGSGLAVACAGQQGEASSYKSSAKVSPCQSTCAGIPCMGSEKAMAGGATMDMALTAEALYQCPMHHEVISGLAEQNCPLCKMKLEKMDESAVVELRQAELHGCPMCPIVRKADEKDKGCTICSMKLMPIEGGESDES